MKLLTINKRFGCFFTCITGAVLILSACSSDDAAQAIADEFVSISGQITSSANPVAGEESVTVKGIYSDNNPLNPSTNSGPDGRYSLSVLKNTAVSVQMSKATFATFNFQKAALAVNITDGDEDLVTELEAQAVLDLALAASPQNLADKAWFVANVTDANGDDINAESFAVNPVPDVEVYLLCDGTDSTLNATSDAPCAPGERAVMYLAYYDAAPAGEVSVTAIGQTQVAPVRMGEITVFDFEQ